MRDNGKWGEGNRVKRYTHKFANFQRKHGERGGGEEPRRVDRAKKWKGGGGIRVGEHNARQ